jgi:BASS family bile acid:Na+ symporter
MIVEQPLLRGLTIAFLLTAMFSIGLQTTGREIVQALRDRRFMERALLVNLVLVPALGVIVALAVPVSREVKLGLILLSLAPGAPFALQFTRLAKESVALAAGLAFFLAIIAIIYTPVLASLLLPLQAPLRMPYGRLTADLLVLLVLPLAVGIVFHRLVPGAARALVKPMFILVTVIFVALVVASGEIRREAAHAVGGLGLLMMLAVIAGAMLIGWALGGPRYSDRRVLAINSSMRNVAVALVVAREAFPAGDVEVAVLAFFTLMVPANMLLSVWATVHQKRQAKRERDQTDQVD